MEDYETSYWTNGRGADTWVKAGVGKPGTWVEISKHFIDSINRNYFDSIISKTASVLENRADAEIDFMFVARNFMAFMKKDTWGPSSQSSDGQGDTAHITHDPHHLTIVQQIMPQLWALTSLNRASLPLTQFPMSMPCHRH